MISFFFLTLVLEYSRMADYTVTELCIHEQELEKLPDDIDKYTNLKRLNCSYNELTSLDNLPQKLKNLDCSYNKLTSLDNLPQNLIELYCNGNKITSLDNLPPTLEILKCWNNQITSLDNLPPKLEVLYCNNNQLKYDFEHTLENIRNYNASRILSS